MGLADDPLNPAPYSEALSLLRGQALQIADDRSLRGICRLRAGCLSALSTFRVSGAFYSPRRPAASTEHGKRQEQSQPISNHAFFPRCPR